MAEIKDILALMRSIAPESATEPGFDDNVGLLVGSERGSTDTALLCLDCTENVIAEAAAKGAKLVISHHPVIFRGIRSVTDGDPTGRTILAAARAGVSVYSAHTNLDFCDGGLNDYAAELAGLSDVRPMLEEGGVKVGRYGRLKETTLSGLADSLAAAFDDRHIRIIGGGAEKITSAAVVNGGGGDIGFLRMAMELADCYVTADVPHHVQLYAAQSGYPLVVMQHYSMEAVYMKRLSVLLGKAAEARGMGVRFAVAESEYNPAQQEVL